MYNFLLLQKACNQHFKLFLVFDDSAFFRTSLLRIIKYMKISKLLVTSFLEQKKLFLELTKKDTTVLNELQKIQLYF